MDREWLRLAAYCLAIGALGTCAAILAEPHVPPVTRIVALAVAATAVLVLAWAAYDTLWRR